MSFPRMSLHIGDYKKDTGHLRAAGHGAYLLLMMHYWSTGHIPDDDNQLAAIACMTDKEWKYWGPIVRAFFKGEGLRHKRIDAELIEAQVKYERRVAAGKKGGTAKANRKQSYSNATPMPDALLKQPITLTDKEEERAPELRSGGTRKRGTRLPDDFQLSEADIEFAAKHGFAGDPLQSIFSDFCDYWRARAGPQGVKLDWSATWRRWIRIEAGRQKPKAQVYAINRKNEFALGLERIGQAADELERDQPISEGCETSPRLLSHG